MAQAMVTDHAELKLGALPPLARYRRYRGGDLVDIGRHTGALFGITPARVAPANTGAGVTLSHFQVDLPRISLILLEYQCSDGDVLFNSDATPHAYILQFCLKGSAELEQDGRVTSLIEDEFVIHHPDSASSGRLSPGCRNMIVKIDRVMLESILSRKIGRMAQDRIVFTDMQHSVRSEGNAVGSIIRFLCDNLDSPFPIFNQTDTARQFEEMLCTLMLQSIPSNYSPEIDDTNAIVPYYVRRVERFIQQNAREEIDFAALVVAAGVSSRTLHEGFRRFRHTTPMNYLKNVRLELAHGELRAPDAATVTEIALGCGFSHLSKFSIEYHKRFGEKPSETRRKHQTH